MPYDKYFTAQGITNVSNASAENFKHGVYKGMGSVGFYKNKNLGIIDYYMSNSGGIDIYVNYTYYMNLIVVTFSDDIIYLGYKKVQG